MTQKERLVELLAQYDKEQIGVRNEVDFYYNQHADFLLSHGVIVLLKEPVSCFKTKGEAEMYLQEVDRRGDDKKTFCVSNTGKISEGFCCLICEQQICEFPRVATAPICGDCIKSLRSLVEAEQALKGVAL